MSRHEMPAPRFQSPCGGREIAGMMSLLDLGERGEASLAEGVSASLAEGVSASLAEGVSASLGEGVSASLAEGAPSPPRVAAVDSREIIRNVIPGLGFMAGRESSNYCQRSCGQRGRTGFSPHSDDWEFLGGHYRPIV